MIVRVFHKDPCQSRSWDIWVHYITIVSRIIIHRIDIALDLRVFQWQHFDQLIHTRRTIDRWVDEFQVVSRQHDNDVIELHNAL
ncbi:hypothetical protein D3C80_2059410 [compost metagenome]